MERLAPGHGRLEHEEVEDRCSLPSWRQPWCCLAMQPGSLPRMSRTTVGEWEASSFAGGLLVGPSTSAQLEGLRHLGYIAEVQGSAPDTAPVPLHQGRRQARPASRRARKRLLTFAANGLVVFVLGVAVQWALIHRLGMGNVSSYMVKSVLSVQLTFLLSRYLTWGDRNIALLPALVRWNVQQLLITGLGVGLYTGLDHFGLNYIAGNVAVAVIFTPTSFVVGHLWSMADRATLLRLRTVSRPRVPVGASRVSAPGRHRTARIRRPMQAAPANDL
jgi:putative flippase GtrA